MGCGSSKVVANEPVQANVARDFRHDYTLQFLCRVRSVGRTSGVATGIASEKDGQLQLQVTEPDGPLPSAPAETYLLFLRSLQQAAPSAEADERAVALDAVQLSPGGFRTFSLSLALQAASPSPGPEPKVSTLVGVLMSAAAHGTLSVELVLGNGYADDSAPHKRADLIVRVLFASSQELADIFGGSLPARPVSSAPGRGFRVEHAAHGGVTLSAVLQEQELNESISDAAKECALLCDLWRLSAMHLAQCLDSEETEMSSVPLSPPVGAPAASKPAAVPAKPRISKWTDLAVVQSDASRPPAPDFHSAVPEIRGLAALEDLRLRIESNSSFFADSNLSVEDILFLENLVVAASASAPTASAKAGAAPSGSSPTVAGHTDFSAMILNKAASAGDPELQAFVVAELVPYQHPVSALGVSLAVVRSLAVFKRSLKRSPRPSSKPAESSSAPVDAQIDSPRDPPEAVDSRLLDLGVDRWDFDLFGYYAQSSGGSPPGLAQIGMYFIRRHGLIQKLVLEETRVVSFWRSLEQHYMDANPYHNQVHASDVLQTTMCLLEQGGYLQCLEPVHLLALIVATAGHDVGHPGLTSPFQIRTMSPLALKFNNQSVLEMHHCCLVFELLMRDENNFLRALPVEDRLLFRDFVVGLILATDVSRTFEYLGKFQKCLIAPQMAASETLEGAGEFVRFAPKDTEELKLMLQLFIKAADVSNPAKPQATYIRWAQRVMREFFRQGDREKEMGLSPVSAFMDRQTCDIFKCQIGFLDFIATPIFEMLDKFDRNGAFAGCLQQLQQNKSQIQTWMAEGRSATVREVFGTVADA